MPRKPTQKRSVDTNGAVRVHGKAANGEGSVYFTSRGQWVASFWLAGEKRPRTVSASTREKALSRRTARIAELEADHGLVRSDLGPKTTVGELACWWLEHVQRHQVREASWARAQDRVSRIVATIGGIVVRDVQATTVAAWQSQLLDHLAPKTVAHHRQTLAQVFDQAVEFGLIAANPVRRVKPPKVTQAAATVLPVRQAQALVQAASSDRYGAAVALLFFQGWRVSEALGLAWEDLDLDHGTVVVRRACHYVDGIGKVLAPTKTTGVLGRHDLAPTVVRLLRQRKVQQDAEKAAADGLWMTHSYEGRPVDVVFTTAIGDLVLRQTITKVVKTAAASVGLDPATVATHNGRRSVVTSLYAEGGESIDEIARFVGHSSPSTTAGYVRDLGSRPSAFARRAAALLDPDVETD